jgi:hypothetical protein
MPDPCSDDVPHIMAGRLNLAQIVPSFILSRNRLVKLTQPVWHFHGRGVAGLNQSGGKRKAALIKGTKAAQYVVVFTALRPKGGKQRLLIRMY